MHSNTVKSNLNQFNSTPPHCTPVPLTPPTPLTAVHSTPPHPPPLPSTPPHPTPPQCAPLHPTPIHPTALPSHPTPLHSNAMSLKVSKRLAVHPVSCLTVRTRTPHTLPVPLPSCRMIFCTAEAPAHPNTPVLQKSRKRMDPRSGDVIQHAAHGEDVGGSCAGLQHLQSKGMGIQVSKGLFPNSMHTISLQIHRRVRGRGPAGGCSPTGGGGGATACGKHTMLSCRPGITY